MGRRGLPRGLGVLNYQCSGSSTPGRIGLSPPSEPFPPAQFIRGVPMSKVGIGQQEDWHRGPDRA